MTTLLQCIFDLQQWNELRRRITRRAMQSLFHASDARLMPMTCLSDTDVHHILICRPNHRLGNLLLLTPLLTEIQQRFPGADVDIVLAGAHGPELFKTFSNVKHIYCLSRRMVRHPIAVVRTALRIRKAHYDLAIDPCEASQSGRLLVAVAGAKYAIGLPRDRTMVGLDGTCNSMADTPHHMAQWPVYLLRRALVRRWPESGNDFPALDIRLSSSERARARAILERMTHEGMPPTPFVIGVFAEATGAKGYSKEWWQCFVHIVHEQHPDATLVEIAPADGQPRFGNEVPFFSSPSPREVAAVISNMTCFVSADCGVMHLASAAGTPTIGLFSVTDASKYAPYAHGSRALDTNGKSPEDVAQEASMLITTFRAGIPVGPCGRSCGDRHDDEGAR